MLLNLRILEDLSHPISDDREKDDDDDPRDDKPGDRALLWVAQFAEHGVTLNNLNVIHLTALLKFIDQLVDVFVLLPNQQVLEAPAGDIRKLYNLDATGDAFRQAQYLDVGLV